MDVCEKRFSPRVMKILEVRFLSPEEKTAITGNISETGLFIRTNSGFDAGRETDLHITLPTGARISLQGSVTRNVQTEPVLAEGEECGMGIQLIDPSLEYTQYIQSISE
jgi:Tfp pilus assembly protein PilZ